MPSQYGLQTAAIDTKLLKPAWVASGPTQGLSETLADSCPGLVSMAWITILLACLCCIFTVQRCLL